MLFNTRSVVVALTAASAVLANHQVTIYNYCGQGKYGHVKSSAFNYVSGLLGTGGGAYTVSIPSLASSLIIFGESGECPGADGPGCTRLECDFSNPSYQQCNLSRVAGFSIPLAWSWTDGGCTGGHCESASAGPADCWVPGLDNGSSLRQCNTANVGVNLYLCGA
ncbi:hypothetical protein FRB94_001751 [Tulasnella sp. JGI-2019a]|nr:hypothetical protein FRB93_002027 [Tulasnella sp. JGI-2019a]KAG9005203.1 hypothetical protein FRB94_001751 [Tulasnella sp. JGI-2019a]KAG9037772.1 hypothetical protein FRB95_004058 [Tulasnella sp. JGI-2019a]